MTTNPLTYCRFLRSVLWQLHQVLPQEVIESLDKDLLSHIGGCYRAGCSPNDAVDLIVSDYCEPPIGQKVPT